jgi:hypothetical protein
MLHRASWRGLLFRGLVGLLASLILTNTSSAEKQKPLPKPKPAPKAAKPAAVLTEQVKLAEAEVLGKAYVLLASGNHDYDGHRAKAMGHVKAAFTALTDSVLAHGNAPQKAAARKGKAALALADKAATQSPTVHEEQVRSDAALGTAGSRIAALEFIFFLDPEGRRPLAGARGRLIESTQVRIATGRRITALPLACETRGSYYSCGQHPTMLRHAILWPNAWRGAPVSA